MEWRGYLPPLRGLESLQSPRLTFRCINVAFNAIGRNPGTSDLPARARREQEFGYEVEVVEGEVNAASVVDPSQSIAAAVY